MRSVHRRTSRFAFAVLFAGSAAAATAQPGMVRITGPQAITPGVPSLIRVEQLRGGGRGGGEWKLVDPDEMQFSLAAGGRVLADPAALAMNPIAVQAEDGAQRVAAVALVGGSRVEAGFAVGPAAPPARVRLQVNQRRPSHQFQGFGGGVLFYDNQWDLSRGDEIWDWCFADIDATFLHILARPDYEPVNDNEDWRTLDTRRMDFAASDRAIRVTRKALAKDPDLKIYLSLYSPPAWMKTNNATGGEGSLKPGLAYRRELAEYLFAYLKRLQGAGVAVDYLAMFNEPDWTHSQDGMHFADLGELADVFDQTAAALEELIAADGTLAMPTLVFPDSLGAGSLTRSRQNTPKLLARSEMLARRVGVWGVHDYWNQGGYWPVRFRELRDFPPVGDKPIWMTEWAQRYRYGDLESANEYGANILNAVRLGAQAWMVFEWCHPSQNQSGLISCDWGAKPPRRRYWRSKAYYVFQQLANATPAGAMVLPSVARSRDGLLDPAANQSQVLEHLAVAADGRLILHLHNRGGDPLEVRATLRGVTAAEAIATGPLGNSQPHAGADLRAGAGNKATLTTRVPANTLVTVTLPAAE